MSTYYIPGTVLGAKEGETDTQSQSLRSLPSVRKRQLQAITTQYVNG